MEKIHTAPGQESFKEIYDRHELSIYDLGYYAGVGGWVIAQMYRGEPVGDVQAARVLSMVNFMYKTNYSFKNVDVCVFKITISPLSGD